MLLCSHIFFYHFVNANNHREFHWKHEKDKKKKKRAIRSISWSINGNVWSSTVFFFHVFVVTWTVIQIIQENKEGKRTYLNIDNDDENKNRFLIEIYSVELFVTQPHCCHSIFSFILVFHTATRWAVVRNQNCVRLIICWNFIIFVSFLFSSSSFILFNHTVQVITANALSFNVCLCVHVFVCHRQSCVKCGIKNRRRKKIDEKYICIDGHVFRRRHIIKIIRCISIHFWTKPYKSQC